MNRRVQWRVGVLVMAIAGIAGLTLWGVQTSWTRITTLERQLTKRQLESFHLAEEFQERLVTLGNMMLHYSARRSPADLARFAAASGQLDLWIDDQRPKLTSDGERRLLDQLNITFNDYQDAAHQVLTNGQPAAISTAAFAELEQVEKNQERLQKLGIELADAHRQSESKFLDDANRSLGYLRFSLCIGVVLLLALVGALGGVLYRDMIAPLRTKLVQSEAVLEKQEKLATLGTLAAGIAHEIRNPLTSIKARLYILGKRLTSDTASTADAAVINTEIARLERIVQEVLKFARPSEPQLKLERADTPLREVHSLMASTLEKESVHLILEPSPTVQVSMDLPLIKQVLINLVRNAAEAIDHSGTIRLRVRIDRAKLNDQTRDVAILEVADDGRGIPPEVEKRLFDPFFTTKEAGTGLGLSIAARIVERHGGALQYQTAPGQGTTFGIVLPLTAVRASEPRTVAA